MSLNDMLNKMKVVTTPDGTPGIGCKCGKNVTKVNNDQPMSETYLKIIEHMFADCGAAPAPNSPEIQNEERMRRADIICEMSIIELAKELGLVTPKTNASIGAEKMRWWRETLLNMWNAGELTEGLEVGDFVIPAGELALHYDGDLFAVAIEFGLDMIRVTRVDHLRDAVINAVTDYAQEFMASLNDLLHDGERINKL